MIFGGIENML